MELFPALGGAAITHRWGGPIGVPRDWYSSVGLDRRTGIGWSGGYVGDGVSTTNLGGRTLADLILARDTDLVRLPWVGPHLAVVGTRALALARGQRLVVGHEDGRQERSPHRGPLPSGRPDGEPPRWLNPGPPPRPLVPVRSAICWWPTSAGSWPAPTPPCSWPTWGPPWSRSRTPTGGTTPGSWGPPWSDGLSTYFQAVNRNKRSFACDLRRHEDRSVARELCSRADVIVENFRSGATEKLGLGPDLVLADNPRAVYCSITGFGSGAGKERLGYDFLVQALGGLMSVTGEPGGPPLKVGVAIVDVVTGLHALAGILAALHHREKTGQGQRIEVNLLSSLLSALVNQASSFLNTETVPTAMGNKHPSIAPYEMVATRDRPLVLAVGNDSQFRALCTELALDALADDERFVTNDVRVAHRHELVAAMNTVFATATAAEWVARLEGRGVPCGPVNGIDEAMALARRLDLDPSVDLTRPDGTVSRQVRHPITYGATPATYDQAPPPWDEVLGPAELSAFLAARQQYGVARVSRNSPSGASNMASTMKAGLVELGLHRLAGEFGADLGQEILAGGEGDLEVEVGDGDP